MLSALARLYGAGLAARDRAYAVGLLEVTRAPIPVVSVGNLSVGGNGKTPLVSWITRRLAARGARPLVVSRGYLGVRDEDPLVVAVDGRATASPEAAGDEPLLLAVETGASVVVGRRRADAVAWALRAIAPPPDVAILDDGFQHRALARDLDLVLLDAADPFPGGALIPAGRLREPPAALARASLVLVHRGGLLALAEPSPLLGALGRPLVEVATRPTRLRALGRRGRLEGVEPSPSGGGDLDGVRGVVSLGALAGVAVHAAAGIARPERFAATLARLGAEVAAHTWAPDHVALDLTRLADAARARPVVITAKDAIKLAPEVRARLDDVYVLDVELLPLAGRARLEAAVDALIVTEAGADVDDAAGVVDPALARARAVTAPLGGGRRGRAPVAPRADAAVLRRTW